MATNVPPMPGPAGAPPPKKKTSPIVWILIGIAGFFVFVFIAVAALGFFAYHKAKQAGFDVALLEKHPELAVIKMAVAANPDLELVSIDENRGLVSVKNKKTGKVSTANFSDIKNGKLSLEEDGKTMTIESQGQGSEGTLAVTTPEGTAKFGGIVKLPSWLPAYAGAKIEGFAAEGTNGAGGGFGFKSQDSAETVTAFYEDALKKSGFQVQATKHAAGAILNAESGARKAVINVMSDGSGSSVNGTFEEK